MSFDVHPPLVAVREAVTRALAEDLAPIGDMTAALVPHTRRLAAFVSREEGVVAGIACAAEAFLQVDPEVNVTWLLADGADVAVGAVLGRVEGPLPSILTAERTALNFLRHLSGIASLTRRYVRAARGQAVVLDTRKTTPGLRALEKAAVRAGGGANHRGSLSDGVLLKDNHLGALAIPDAVRTARLRWPGRLVEVECDTIDQVREAVKAGATMVMLDNMTPDEVRACVAEVDGRALVEVSGRLALDTIGEYATIEGVDFVSVGAITHSAGSLDIGLDLDVHPDRGEA